MNEHSKFNYLYKINVWIRSHGVGVAGVAGVGVSGVGVGVGVALKIDSKATPKILKYI